MSLSKPQQDLPPLAGPSGQPAGPSPAAGVSGPGKLSQKQVLARKAHAIGLLTKRILERLPETVDPTTEESWEVNVDDVIAELKCTKVAVCEVFNVFEALLLTTKIGRSTYRWNGFGQIKTTLAFLRHIGIVLEARKHLEAVKEEELNELDRTNRTKEDAFFGNFFANETQEQAGGEEVQNVTDWQDVNMMTSEDVNRHILAICSCFVTLFLVMDKPRVMTLEFASKVIQRFSGTKTKPPGEETPFEALSRTRRLYDVSNILMNLRLPLLKKVRVTQVGSANKTFLQYVGPEILDDTTLTEEDILALPDYRREHLFYSAGKKMWGIPERPVSLPGTRAVRLERNAGSKDFEVVDAGTGDGLVYLGRGNSTASALQPNKLLFADVVTPLKLDSIVALETEKMLASLRGSAGEKTEFAKRLGTSGDDGDEDSRVFTNVGPGSEVYLTRVTIKKS